VKFEDGRAFYEKVASAGNVIVMSVNMRSKFHLRGIFRSAQATGAPVIIQRSISEFVQGIRSKIWPVMPVRPRVWKVIPGTGV